MIDFIINWLPVTALLIVSVLDTYKIFRGDRKMTNHLSKYLLPVCGFILFYILFINIGIKASVLLINQQITKGFGFWTALFVLPLGYLLSKKLYYHFYKNLKDTKSPSSYNLFLHYFVFTTGSVAFLFLVMIIIFITRRLLS